MTTNPDVFTLRLAAALVKQEEQQQPGGFVVRRTPKSGLGALRDLFYAITRLDERDPAAIVIGLDCSDASAQASFERDVGTDVRDVLVLYEDHVLLVGNPVRGAGLGTMVKLLADSFTKRGKAQSTPHSRMQRDDLRTAELLSGRPSWGRTEQFVHLRADDREIWFWVDLPADSEDRVRSVLASLQN